MVKGNLWVNGRRSQNGFRNEYLRKEKNVKKEKDIIETVNEIFRNESEHNRRIMIAEEEADRSEEYIKNLLKGYERGEHDEHGELPED